MTTMVVKCFGVDYGRYTPPDTIDHQRMLDAGILWHCIGITGNPWADQHFQLAIDRGVPYLDAYVIPRSFTENPSERALWAADKLERWRQFIGIVWLDAEQVDAGAVPAAQVAGWLRGVRRILENRRFRCGLYSNRRQWDQVLGLAPFDEEFRDLPRWDACYDDQPYSGYSGAWAGRVDEPAVDQFAGSRTVFGANVDLNWVAGEERIIMDDQIKALFREVLEQEGRLGEKIDKLRAELLVDSFLLASGRNKEVLDRVTYEATAAQIQLPQ